MCSHVIAAIFSSVSYLEAMINELYAHAADRYRVRRAQFNLLGADLAKTSYTYPCRVGDQRPVQRDHVGDRLALSPGEVSPCMAPATGLQLSERVGWRSGPSPPGVAVVHSPRPANAARHSRRRF